MGEQMDQGGLVSKHKSYSVQEAAREAGVSCMAVSVWIKRGLLPGAVRQLTRRGFRWAIPGESWRALVAANRTHPFADVRERAKRAGLCRAALRHSEVTRLYDDPVRTKYHLRRIRQSANEERGWYYPLEILEEYEQSTMGTRRHPVVRGAT